MAYRIKHITRYSYATPVVDCTNQIMLYPLQDNLQDVKKHDLVISHNPEVEVFTDYYGNMIGMFTIVQPHRELIITSFAEVTTSPIQLLSDGAPADQQWEQLSAVCEQIPYMDFLQKEAFKAVYDLQTAVDNLYDAGKTPFENAVTFSGFVYDNFEYRKGITSVETKVEEIWQLKAGVCQDFAHLLLMMLRMIRIPSRYVSGYICPKDHELRGEGATHAWVEAYIPGFGWIGLDPTNNCVVSDGHIRLAVGRNFNDCTPVKGTYKGSSAHTLEVSVIIENGKSKTATGESGEQPVFSYHATNPAIASNSYRYYMEQQQQQQQQ